MIQNVQVLSRYNERGRRNRTETAALHKISIKRTYVRTFVFGLILLAILSISGVASALFGNKDAYAATIHAAPQPTVIVEQGDTLWSIASQYSAKGQDVREYVYQLRKLNGLKNSTLQVGQKLLLPAAR